MIVKDILSGKIYSETDLRISSFKPTGLRETLSTIPPDNFVLGVGYNQGDYQICISGRKKSTEDISHTFNRELYEELSLVPATLPLVYTKYLNNYFAALPIAETQLLAPNLFAESGEDDTKQRAIICIYGNFMEIMSYLSLVKIHPDNNDCITHIWADKIKNILEYI